MDPIVKLWYAIKQRCFDSSHPAYADYGGRGIKVYGPWIHNRDSFVQWVQSNLGPRPDGTSLDRIHNDGHYEPGNLRWATPLQQAQNRRPYRKVIDESKPQSGHVGINWHVRHQKWDVVVQGKWVGRFKDLGSAIQAKSRFIGH